MPRSPYRPSQNTTYNSHNHSVKRKESYEHQQPDSKRVRGDNSQQDYNNHSRRLTEEEKLKKQGKRLDPRTIRWAVLVRHYSYLSSERMSQVVEELTNTMGWNEIFHWIALITLNSNQENNNSRALKKNAETVKVIVDKTYASICHNLQRKIIPTWYPKGVDLPFDNYETTSSIKFFMTNLTKLIEMGYLSTPSTQFRMDLALISNYLNFFQLDALASTVHQDPATEIIYFPYDEYCSTLEKLITGTYSLRKKTAGFHNSLDMAILENHLDSIASVGGTKSNKAQKDIAGICYHLAKFAEYKRFNHKIRARTLNSLINFVNAWSFAVANDFYSISIWGNVIHLIAALEKNNYIEGELNKESFNEIYEKFWKNVKSYEIRDSLINWASHPICYLGLLAKKQFISKTIEHQNVNVYIENLLKQPSFLGHDAAKLLIGIAELTYEKKISGKVDQLLIERLMQRVALVDNVYLYKYRDVMGLTYLSIGFFMESQALSSPLNFATVKSLLEKLPNLRVDSVVLSVHGLSLLFKHYPSLKEQYKTDYFRLLSNIEDINSIDFEEALDILLCLMSYASDKKIDSYLNLIIKKTYSSSNFISERAEKKFKKVMLFLNEKHDYKTMKELIKNSGYSAGSKEGLTTFLNDLELFSFPPITVGNSNESLSSNSCDYIAPEPSATGHSSDNEIMIVDPGEEELMQEPIASAALQNEEDSPLLSDNVTANEAFLAFKNVNRLSSEQFLPVMPNSELNTEGSCSLLTLTTSSSTALGEVIPQTREKRTELAPAVKSKKNSEKKVTENRKVSTKILQNTTRKKGLQHEIIKEIFSTNITRVSELIGLTTEQVQAIYDNNDKTTGQQEKIKEDSQDKNLAVGNSKSASIESNIPLIISAIFSVLNEKENRTKVSKIPYNIILILLKTCTAKRYYQLAIDKKLDRVFIYLNIADLKELFHYVLRSLQFYRHSNASLAVINALITRHNYYELSKKQGKNVDAQQKEVLKLILQLFVKAIEFHKLAAHNNKAPMLIEKLRAFMGKSVINKNHLPKESKTLLEKVNSYLALPVISIQKAPGEIMLSRLLAFQPAAIQKKTITSTAKSAPRHTKNLTSAPVAREPLRNANSTVQTELNVNYLYVAEDIGAILNARIKEFLVDNPQEMEITVLAAAQMNDIPGNKVGDVIESFTQENAPFAPRFILIPIQVANHWVGVKIEIEKIKVNNKEEVKIHSINFFNSINNVRSNHHYVNRIKENLLQKGLIPDNFTINIAGNTYLQNDGVSCGPCLVEMLVTSFLPVEEVHRLVIVDAKKPDTALAIRAKQAHALSRENPSLHRNFMEAQKDDNFNFLSVEQQWQATLQRENGTVRPAAVSCVSSNPNSLFASSANAKQRIKPTPDHHFEAKENRMNRS